MNQDQINSLVRSILKIAGTALAAHGLTAAANLVNSEDLFGLVVLLVAIWQSHQHHNSRSAGGSPASLKTSASLPSVNGAAPLAGAPKLRHAGGPPALLPAADQQASPATPQPQPNPTL